MTTLTPAAIAEELETCARSWEPQACLLGNVTAAQILALLAERKRYRAALSEVKDAIKLTASDTVWMSDTYPMTVCDFIESALEDAHE